MRSVTSTDLSRRPGAVCEMARCEVVLVTRNQHPQCYMVPAPEYERLRRLDRRAIRASELPDDLLAAITSAQAPDEAARYNEEVPEAQI